MERRGLGKAQARVRFSLAAPAVVGQLADREFRKLEMEVQVLSAAPDGR